MWIKFMQIPILSILASTWKDTLQLIQLIFSHINILCLKSAFFKVKINTLVNHVIPLSTRTKPSF